MTRGGRICFFRNLANSRLAACLSRRRWTRTSSTTPVWSTARQSQCFTPAILSTTLVEMPFVTDPGKAATDLVGEMLTKLARPLSDCFVADDDAAGRQQLLN